MASSLAGKSKIGFPFFILFILVSTATIAQRTEVGLGLGATTYTGELVRGYDISLNRPAFTAFYRTNFSDALSVKYSLTAGFLTATDETPVDPFAELRDYSFDVFLLEAAVSLEYHFLDFKSEKSRTRYSPYLFAGAGLFSFSGHDEKVTSYSNIQPTIPFGVGVKYVLNQRLILGLEFGARKTFTDYLDNVSDKQLREKNYNYGNEYDNDWYYFTGITLSYTFYNIPCPYKYH